jgi:hypothetical protein
MKNNKMILVQFVRFLTVVLNLPSIILGKCVDMKRWMLPFFRGSNRSRKTTSHCSHVCTCHIVSHGFGIGTWVRCLHWMANKTQPIIQHSWNWHAGTDTSFQWHCIWFTSHGLSEICLGWNFKPHYISSHPFLWLPCGLFLLLSIFSII